MTNYISNLDVSLDDADESRLKSNGFKRINVNLNEGLPGNVVYLWYKNGADPITSVQVTFNLEMEVGLQSAGHTKIPKDLNAGAQGDAVYLWYFKGQTQYDVPIVEVDVTTDAESEAKKFADDWESLTVNLNHGAGGKRICAWLKRERKTYICDVTATASYNNDADNLKDGYIRVNESTNKDVGGAPVFIWYRQTTDSAGAVQFLQISTKDSEYKSLQNQSYTPVEVNLNEGAGQSQVYLWFKKDGDNKPVKGITLIFSATALQAYGKAGVNVIKRSLNTGTGGSPVYLCVHQ